MPLHRPSAAPARSRLRCAPARRSRWQPLRPPRRSTSPPSNRPSSLAKKSRTDEATSVEGTIADPVARKLVEWVILRSDDADLDFPRYAAFIAANPGWPGSVFLRRRAEAALWQQQLDPRAVIAFFANEPARTAKGRFALAQRSPRRRRPRRRASACERSLAQGRLFRRRGSAGAAGQFDGLITPADDKARMDARFDVDDEEAGAAGRAASLAASRSPSPRRAPRSRTNPARPRRCSMRYRPRLGRMPATSSAASNGCAAPTRISEAAQLMTGAPREPERLGDVDQWWVERRLLARKAARSRRQRDRPIEVASGAATPVNENYRAEQQFTAGWIALRFLGQPTLALGPFRP